MDMSRVGLESRVTCDSFTKVSDYTGYVYTVPFHRMNSLVPLRKSSSFSDQINHNRYRPTAGWVLVVEVQQQTF